MAQCLEIYLWEMAISPVGRMRGRAVSLLEAVARVNVFSEERS